MEEARHETITYIIEYEICFKRSALFMIKRKYHDLDLSDVDLTLMEGYDVPDLNDGPTVVEELVPKANVVQDVDGDDPLTPNAQLSLEPNIVDPINVSSQCT